MNIKKGATIDLSVPSYMAEQKRPVMIEVITTDLVSELI